MSRKPSRDALLAIQNIIQNQLASSVDKALMQEVFKNQSELHGDEYGQWLQEDYHSLEHDWFIVSKSCRVDVEGRLSFCIKNIMTQIAPSSPDFPLNTIVVASNSNRLNAHRIFLKSYQINLIVVNTGLFEMGQAYAMNAIEALDFSLSSQRDLHNIANNEDYIRVEVEENMRDYMKCDDSSFIEHAWDAAYTVRDFVLHPPFSGYRRFVDFERGRPKFSDETRQKSIYINMYYFILLHELAHIQLDPGVTSNIKESDLELSCDRWALIYLAKLNSIETNSDKVDIEFILGPLLFMDSIIYFEKILLDRQKINSEVTVASASHPNYILRRANILSCAAEMYPNVSNIDICSQIFGNYVMNCFLYGKEKMLWSEYSASEFWKEYWS